MSTLYNVGDLVEVKNKFGNRDSGKITNLQVDRHQLPSDYDGEHKIYTKSISIVNNNGNTLYVGPYDDWEIIQKISGGSKRRRRLSKKRKSNKKRSIRRKRR
jgi:hypothetical protein